MFVEDFDFCQAVGIKLVDCNMNIIGLYRSQKNSNSNFLVMLEKYLSEYRRNLILGDFNINLLDFEDIDVTNYIQLVNSYGHLFLNNRTKEFATRCKNGVSTIIDHIITDLLGHIYNMNTSDTSLSDHKQILLQMSKTSVPRQSDGIKFKVLDYDKLLSDSLWAQINTSVNLEMFCSHLNKLIIRNTRVITKKSKLRDVPWITPEIQNLVKEREKFFKLKNKFKDNIFLADRYKTLSALVASKIKKAKRERSFRYVSENINKPKELWKYFNQLIFNRINRTKQTVTSIKSGATFVTEEKAIADCFNDYFMSITTTIARHFNQPNLNDFAYLTYNISHPFQLYLTNEDEVKESILSINSKAAIGFDNISAKVLQFTVNYITPLLVKHINSSFDKGFFPDCIKTAKVIPIHKSGDESDLANYRPISILSALSKIYEKIILNRLKLFLSSNNVISKSQFGFTLNSSTIAACINFTDFISRNIDKKQFCACLFLDLRKAFDTVNADILLLKLTKLRFTPEQLNLFESYLKNRSQFVKINNSISEEQKLNLGVPQGSILGPTLFNIYINDIVQNKLEGEIQLYADDCVVMYKSESLEDLLENIKKDLVTLNHWFNINHLSLNYAKSKYIVFNNRKLDENVLKEHPITYNSSVIERVHKYSYLGLIINSNFDWFDHIDKTKNNILPYIFVINRLKHILPKKGLLLIYHAFIQSRLIYLNPIWSGSASYKVKELEILQKRVLKYIINAPKRYPTSKLFEEFQSLTFLGEKELLILISKINHNQIKHNFELINVHSQHDHNTRRKSHFIVRYFRTNVSNNNILYRGMLKFNELPPEIKHLTCAFKFKKKITEYLKAKYDNNCVLPKS